MSKVEIRRDDLDPPERDLIDRLEREREPPKPRRTGIADLFQILVGGPAGLLSGHASILGRRR